MSEERDANDILEDPVELAKIAARAGREAHQRALASGAPVLIAKDGWVVRIYADGREERIQPLLTVAERQAESAKALGK